MRTTVEIAEDIYKELVRISIEKYGNTKGISKVINEILTKELKFNKKKMLEKLFGIWKDEKIENLREKSAKEWEERVKELGLLD